MKTKLVILLLSLITQIICGTNYALIVVGSNGWGNYRHQADGCRAYHALIDKGFQAENIIHFSYDDIAHNERNPFPGKIFAEPSPDSEGKDVYANCKIDYRGDLVTPENFLAVLLGEQEKVQGPVLKSTSDDHVFIFFDDHGGPDVICFPNDDLHKNDLIKTFEQMHKKKIYSKLVIYVEACYSGSMFNKTLKEKLNIYAVTAANERESSYATYCYPDDQVNGVHLENCLSDLFSMNWMDNLEKTLNPESLEEQFDYLVKTTTESHVKHYGNFSFLKENMLDFESGDYGEKKSLGYLEEPKEESEYLKNTKKSTIPAFSIEHIIKRRVAEDNKNDEGKLNDAIEIETEVLKLQKFFSSFRRNFGIKRDYFGEDDASESAISCYKSNIRLYFNKFGRNVDYAYGFLGYIRAACEFASTKQVADFISFN